MIAYSPTGDIALQDYPTYELYQNVFGKETLEYAYAPIQENSYCVVPAMIKYGIVGDSEQQVYRRVNLVYRSPHAGSGSIRRVPKMVCIIRKTWAVESTMVD